MTHVLVFFVSGAVAVLAGTAMARQADRIAEVTALGRLWIGSVLLAAATSLPELATDVSAVRLDAVDLAVGDLLGSSMANMLILDGAQPVGRGIGLALEARDVLAVLQGQRDAPADLRDRASLLAGHVLEVCGAVAPGGGASRARQVLDDGRAWRKFQAICEAQGGMREPPVAPYHREIPAARSGSVSAIDNRRLARVAKLAGAPLDPAAGIERCVRLGTRVDAGQPLFTVHSESPGELAYALDFLRSQPAVIQIDDSGPMGPHS